MADAPRADAQRNRERILDVAAGAFADDPGVSMNQIAKQSGVGAGTLYRHFPTREDLLLAVYAHEIDGLAAAVEDSLAEQSPLDAFRYWARRLAGYVRIKHGLGDALTTASAQSLIDSTYAPVTGAIQRFLDAGVATGDVRPDVRASDVLIMLGALWRVPETPEGLEQADRLLELVVASLG
ncbi:TetR/AcrR family transcriptional regulator [Curtobacterium pusillum]|uniref:TetR/AcrR family transcriptional regulator n=1 Tax=Curtobacterium pusillum TaxID=69373 RepID=UPI0037F156F6